MNKTLKKHVLLIKVLMPFGCIYTVQSVEAQTITKPLNSYRSGDEITRLRVAYVEPESKGENCIWKYDGSVLNAKECKLTESTVNGAITCLEFFCYSNLFEKI